MTLPQFKEEVWTGKYSQHLYLLTGEESEVRKRYLEKIKKQFGNVFVTNDISNVCGSMSESSLFDDGQKLYIVVNDEKFLSEKEEILETYTSGEIIGDSILILVYTELDGKTKFAKKFEPFTIKFDKLNDNILIKYIKKEFPDMTLDNCKYIIQSADGYYSGICNELHKIKCYCAETDTLPNEAVEYFLNCGMIEIKYNYSVFEIVDCILKGNVNGFYHMINNTDSGHIAIISVLYNELVALTQVQLHNNKDTAKVTGLQPFQIKNARERVNVFRNDELVKFLKIVRYCMESIKTGKMLETEVLDYIMVRAM